MATEQATLLIDATIYLSATVIAVPIAKKLGLGSVLGYLLAGIAIGPWCLKLVTDSQTILHFSEFGVVLLLFLIGLELNPKQLWQMRKPILGLGGTQLILTTVLLTMAGILFGIDWHISLIAGMALSLSSTAIALQTLTEKNLLTTPAGNSGFSILLFQDIAVIPMLAIIPMLGIMSPTEDNQAAWIATLTSIAMIIFIIVVGHYLTRPVLRLIAQTKSREVFTAFSLLLVMGISLAMKSVDLSMALGSFLAGVLLADSEYRHQLKSDIEPFKGLLLGLFFIAVGMSIDFGLVISQPLIIIAITIGLVSIKILVLLLLARKFKIPLSQHAFFVFVLSQGGEFAFVLFGVATNFSALPQEIADILIVVVAFSMLLTPLLLILNEKFIEPRFSTTKKEYTEKMELQYNPVVIAGFGRFGQIVARLLHANKISTTIIEHNPDHIERVRKFGYKVFYGETDRLELLHSAGLHQAKVFVLATDDRESGLHTIKLIQEHFPHIKILARAWDLIHVYQLKDLKIESFQRETFDSALRLGTDALIALGFEKHFAHRATQQYRSYDLEMIDKLYEVHKDQDQLISITQESRAEIERLLDEDNQSLVDNWEQK